jgi:hypothetical protein
MSELEPFNAVQGSAREPIDVVELSAAPKGSIAEDGRRSRPFYFDGRFLTARDLTREQQYALIRQADLAQAAGAGVVRGLSVALGTNSHSIVIGAGHGITPGGEMVVLRQSRTIEVGNIPVAEQLGGSLEIDFVGDTRVAGRSGLFALVLRPVEYADQPALALPTSTNGSARIEAADIVEAAALACIPLDNIAPAESGFGARSQLAREVFLRGGLRQLSGEALPLAVIAIDRGNVTWVDEHLLRRRAGTHGVLGYGLAERATREAYWYQYGAQLRDVLSSRAQQGLDRRLIASEYFLALPPVGWVPRESVHVVDKQLVQWFFPPEFNVELGVVPADELPRLMEEGSPLAPFELDAPKAALEAMAVLLLVPVRREEFSETIADLQTRAIAPPPPQTTRPTLRVQPIQALDTLRRRHLPVVEAASVPVNLAPWERALAAAPALYFVRRRQSSPVSFIVPRYEAVRVAGSDPLEQLSGAVRDRLVAAGESAATRPPLHRLDFLLRRLRSADVKGVTQGLDALLATSAFDTTEPGRTLLLNGVVAELAYRARIPLEELAVLTKGGARSAGTSAVRLRSIRAADVDAVAKRYADGQAGEGWIALMKSESKLGELGLRLVLADTLLVPEIDAVARDTSIDRDALAQGLLALGQSADLQGISALLASPPSTKSRSLLSVRRATPLLAAPRRLPSVAGWFAGPKRIE